MPVVQRCFHDFIIIHHFVCIYSTVLGSGADSLRFTGFWLVFLVLDYFRVSIISVTDVYYRIFNVQV